MTLPLRLPIDTDLIERLDCVGLNFSGVTVIEGLRPFIRMQFALPNGWIVWTDFDFDTEDAAYQMYKGLLSTKMQADAIIPLTRS